MRAGIEFRSLAERRAYEMRFAEPEEALGSFELGESYEDKTTGTSYLCIEEAEEGEFAIGLEEITGDDGSVIGYGDMVPLRQIRNYIWL